MLWELVDRLYSAPPATAGAPLEIDATLEILELWGAGRQKAYSA